MAGDEVPGLGTYQIPAVFPENIINGGVYKQGSLWKNRAAPKLPTAAHAHVSPPRFGL